jgi:transposase-like protein
MAKKHKDLTEKQRKRYVKQGGARCPVCRSDDIFGKEGFDFYDRGLLQSCACSACGANWTDTYTLTGVELDSI